MRRNGNQELTERFIELYRNYYRKEIGTLAQQYPNEKRSLYIDYDDLYHFDRDLADDYLAQPDQIQEYAEEALRLYDLPADVKLGNAHVRIKNLPSTIDSLSVHDNHIGKLVAIKGIISKADDKSVNITDAALECQRCGTMNYIPQETGEFQEPQDCQGCGREGPFKTNFDQSEFIDRQRFVLRSTETDLADGHKPLEIRVFAEDDIVGVSAGNYVTVNGVLHIEQIDTDKKEFEPFLDAVSITSTDESSPSFGPPEHDSMDMDTFLEVATNTLPRVPDTALEPGTKAKLITPFVEALGWNKFDNDEWRFEYTDSKTEKRVDYALFAEDSESPAVVVEAKHIGKSLHEGEPQIYDYLRIFSADYGVVTNGKSYRIYRNYPKKKPERVAEIELHEVANAGILDELRPSAFEHASNTDDGSAVSEPADNMDASEGDQAAEDGSESDDHIDSKDRILNIINQLEADHENGVPLELVVEQISKRGMKESEVTGLIDSLAMKGSIYYVSKSQIKTT